MSALRRWGRDEIAPADATPRELTLHWALHGDLKVLAPARAASARDAQRTTLTE